MLIVGSGPYACSLARQAAADGRPVQLLRLGDPADPTGSVASFVPDGRSAGAPFFALRPGPVDHGGVAAMITAADTVQLIGLDPERSRMLADLARAGGATVTTHAVAATTGTVGLVGSGPGDPDLMTIRAVRTIASADVILVDRLAAREALAELAPQALLIDVGKLPGHHAVPQARIEAELVAQGVAGCRVVRLKGGDPFVFGRGGEELVAARAAGLPVEVVPGVSSAIAVPAAAGISVTWREVSRGFVVVSGHAPLDERELAHLAGLGVTIVVLMGVGNLPHLCAGLVRHGLAAGTPAAVIEQAFGPRQRTTTATLSALPGTCAAAGVGSPAVIVIGDVVGLSSEALTAAAGSLERQVCP